MKKVIIALTVVFAVLTMQACDSNNQGSEAVDLNCGDTLTASSRTLKATQDALNCSGTAVTLGGGVTFDLDGHTVSCDGSAGSVGILLSGEGATVKNGIVENCEAGVLAQGDGGHTIRDMTAQNNFGERDVELAGGFVIDSDNNTLRNVKATGNDPVGLQLVGDGNEVRDSDVSNNDHAGIVIFGDSNEVFDTEASNNNFGNVGIVSVVNNELRDSGKFNLISNVVANGDGENNGIYVGADFNTVTGSEADENEVSGILIGPEGEDNTLTNNSAFDNNQSAESGDDRGGTDLAQGDADNCDNTWLGNLFGTSNSDCIE